jgi:DNA-binding NarL/FixJ family response regulator
MNRIRVLLVEDHEIVRTGIRLMLERLPEVEVVGEADNGETALQLIDTLRPSLALLDIEMPGMSGLEVAAQAARWPDLRVVMLSARADPPSVYAAFRAGAKGYLLKTSAAEELTLAVHAAMRGETYISPAIAGTVVAGYMAHETPSSDPLAMLTPRQRQILQFIAQGHATKEIAFRLGVSVKTVETHRAQLMDRLGIHDIAGLVRLAVRVGLVPSG